MSSSHFDPDWTAKVTVPVRRVGDKWEFFYGGDVPVREGTLGELTIDAHDISDATFRQRVSQELVVPILEQGKSLFVALSDRSCAGVQTEPWPDVHRRDIPAGTTRFERITLGPRKTRSQPSEPNGAQQPGGLWLKLKGLERSELTGSTVHMPEGFDPPEASSLNHALTLLSKTHETHRISNTGNVYTKVFYQDSDKRWYPLNDLRAGVQAEAERGLLHDLWKQVEQKLGWRPAPVSKREK